MRREGILASDPEIELEPSRDHSGRGSTRGPRHPQPGASVLWIVAHALYFGAAFLIAIACVSWWWRRHYKRKKKLGSSQAGKNDFS
jgi:hypothetical protein